MKSFKYLVIGGGLAADSAVEGIRETDGQGSIGVISAESSPPYDRPPLTKGLWKDTNRDSIWRKGASKANELLLGRAIRDLSPRRREVTDAGGQTYTFEKLLIATGARPRTLPFAAPDVLYYRTIDDYNRLRELTNKRDRFLIIGGGFIASELAASLAGIHKHVAMVFPGQAIGARIFPPELAHFLNDYYQSKGVELVPGQKVTTVSRQKEHTTVITEGGRRFEVDGVVAGLGVEPNVELAKNAGLRVDNGVVVDQYLCTSHPDIYAAGDVAAFSIPALRRRMRIEHEDNARTMGIWAGRNMAGSMRPYAHLPFFYSDLFDLGYEAVGELDSGLSMVADWQEPFRKGVIYYHREGKVRGVLLWNVWGQVEAARELIREQRSFEPKQMESGLLKAA